MGKRKKSWQQRLLLAAAAIAACCQLFHAHYHEPYDRSHAPAAREMRAEVVPSLRFAADVAVEIDAHGDFCPICAGLFTSDVPNDAPLAPSLNPPAAAARFSADAAPSLFFPLPPGRAPPSSRA